MLLTSPTSQGQERLLAFSSLKQHGSSMPTMVRRGSKRLSVKDVAIESPTHPTILEGSVSKDLAYSSRRSRAQTPPKASQRSRRRSKRNGWQDPGTSFSDHAHRVPAAWTTTSGKFDPRVSELGFDAKSNIGLHGAVVHASSSRSVGTDDSGTPSSDDSKTGRQSSRHRNKKNAENEILEGEIEDPVKRNKFYKSLKKAGIKKTLTIDEDWENNSECSDVSELSMSNASYILDLAQQKETRKKDREEMALEEALELYGTWLTEGKNDDKNIFLMILHEVKKESKAKYAEADKHHDALLDAALDDELKRRERIKQEEEEERLRKAAELKETEMIPVPEPLEPADASETNERLYDRSSRTKRSSYSRESDTKISEIIEKSQRDLNIKAHDDYPDNLNELSISSDEDESSINEADEASKPGSKKFKIFGMFGSGKTLESVKEPSSSSKSKSRQNSVHSKEDSQRMFSRLRKQLSVRQLEEWKEAERSWKSKDTVETNEEQWWKKISDAKKESVMFEKGIALLDLSTRTNPGVSGTSSNPKNSETLDRSSRSTPANIRPSAVGADTEKKPKEKRKKSMKFNPDSDSADKEKEGAEKEKEGLEAPSKTEKKKKKKNEAASGVGDVKAPKSKDKKKKKKSNHDSREFTFDGEKDGAIEKPRSTKKKEKSNSRNSRLLQFGDEPGTKLPKSPKKKPGRLSVAEAPISPTKKKKVKSKLSNDNGDTSNNDALRKKKRKSKRQSKSPLRSNSERIQRTISEETPESNSSQ